MIFRYAVLFFIMAIIPGVLFAWRSTRPSLAVAVCALLPALTMIAAGAIYDQDANGGDLEGVYLFLGLITSPIWLVAGAIAGVLTLTLRRKIKNRYPLDGGP